jgi:LPS export ABC transporter protein LptC
MGCNPEEVCMKLSKLIILVCMGVILSAIGVYLLFGESDDAELVIPEVQDAADKTADLTIEDIHYVETKGEKKAWELKAKTGQHFREADYTTLEDLTVTFYAEGGRIITLKGNSGSVRGREEIEVSGDVVIISSDGYRVTTNSLHYSDEKQQISTDDPVTLEGKGVQVKGVGAVVDLKTKKVSILRKVQTVIK